MLKSGNLDFEYFCSTLGHLMGVQVRLYRENDLLYDYCNMPFSPNPLELIAEQIESYSNNAGFFDQGSIFFGLIRVPEQQLRIVIGPAFNVRPGKEQTRAMMRQLGVSGDRMQEFSVYLDSIPPYPIESFIQVICFGNYFFNREKLLVSDLILHRPLPEDLERPTARPEYDDGGSVHNTMALERELLGYITGGREEALKRLFSEPPTGRVGVMAYDKIRQIKNTFVCSATLASRAAISGGMSPEIAFTLSDHYIRKAELLSDFASITDLNIRMLLDFARRVKEQNLNGNRSPRVSDISRYIDRNLNGKIALEDIAAELGMSRTHLCAVFKQETGMTINEYITQRKVEEAKRLLAGTDRSVGSIGEGLGFSSQCYFQNVFKKAVGVTPLEFRKQHG